MLNVFGGSGGSKIGLQLESQLNDLEYEGTVIRGVAGAALAFGEICYFATDSKWKKAKADVAATSSAKLGVCVLAAKADAAATVILLLGNVRANAQFPTMTVGAPVYLSAATAGVVTSTAPAVTTDFVVRKLGFANNADEFYFSPSNDYTVLP